MDSKGSFLDKLIIEKISFDDNVHNFGHFSKKLLGLAKSKNDEDIVINDAKTHITSNLLAMQELINLAEETIRVYTADIRDDIYGDPIIILNIVIWLNQDKNRKLYFLIRDEINIKDRGFNKVFEQFPKQVLIQKIKLKNAESCNKNVVIVDKQAIKLKKIKDNTEYVVVNFGAKKEAIRLVKLFDKNFNKSCLLSDDTCEIVDNTKFDIDNCINNIPSKMGYMYPNYDKKVEIAI